MLCVLFCCDPAEVESHPFDVDTMLFMDWRDDHLADLPEVKTRNSKLPTFLYAMPFTKNKVRAGRGFQHVQPLRSYHSLSHRDGRHSLAGRTFRSVRSRLPAVKACNS